MTLRHAQLTPEKMRLSILRLERCIPVVEAFDPSTVTCRDDALARAEALHISVDEALVQNFGYGTVEHVRYSGANTFGWSEDRHHQATIHEIRTALTRCRDRSLLLLHQAISFLQNELELSGDLNPDELVRPPLERTRSALGANDSDPNLKPKDEVVTLKPSLWGLSVDLKALFRRVAAWWRSRG